MCWYYNDVFTFFFFFSYFIYEYTHVTTFSGWKSDLNPFEDQKLNLFNTFNGHFF